MDSSKDRENFVYVAKLAEQAERYDGQSLPLDIFICVFVLSLSLTLDLCFHVMFLLIIELNRMTDRRFMD